MSSAASRLPLAPPGLPLCEVRFPLAAEQRGLWYVQQLAPDCGAYHLVFSFEVDKTGDCPVNHDAVLAQLIEDYPVLRTSLPATEDGPVQHVWPVLGADIRHGDGRGIEADQLREQLRSDTRLPFDLARPPLWRIHCYRTGDARWAVALVAHHVLLDFWSLGLLLQEAAVRFGLAATAVPALDGSGFGEYAVRQAASLSDPAGMSASLAYWRAALRDAPPVHGLALDHPRPALQTHEGRTLSFALPRDVSDGIKLLARTSDATPFMVLLSAYYVLLHRFSGDTDIVVVSPVAGRLERAQRRMLGQFVNTVALRAQVDPAAPFSQLLSMVRHRVIEALRHQQYPFSRLVEELAPQRDPSYAPLAQLGFSWERLPLLSDFSEFFMANPSSVEREGPGFMLRPYALPQQEGQLDLLLEMGGERDGALVGVLKYHDQLFNKESVAELVQAFVALAGAIVAAPESNIGDLALVEPARMTSWLERGAGLELALPSMTVLAQIRHQAAITPDAVAVQDQRTSLSYRALLEQADQLALRLRQTAPQPESRIGVMLERRCDLLVAILGVWAAGAAYVPLDPTFPADRLRMIADDAQLAAIVSDTSLNALWPAVPVVCMDHPLPPLSQWPAEAVLESGATAYLLYTSGSTGKPKGVRVGESSVRNFLHSMQELLKFDSGTRLLAVTTHAFDISVLELLLPLLSGGTVVICDRADTMDGARLAHRLESDRINVLQATPATWKLLIDTGWQGTPGLTALCGGDSLPHALAEALLQRVDRLWNMYGPTETTVWSTAARVKAGEPVHLGAPIGNTDLYVLDERQRPTPPGVPGELWIGGAGLALDYWGMPELTARQFTTLASLPHAGRLYRTGDSVRWRADGLLTHLGRLDFQVKLRGYRIELGEIETALRRQPGIGDALVVVRKDRAGDARLVAYLVGAHCSSAVLGAALRESLPAYMVPSAFIFLDAFPQTANRKIDRKALPAPGDSGAPDTFEAPRDTTEIQLAHLFAQALGLAQVGIHDDFFAIGGHSLLAVQVMAGVKRLFGVELPVSTMVQHASVAALALRLRGESGVETPMLLTLRSGKETQPLWLFHPIGGNVFCYLELARQADPHRPVLAFQAPGLDTEGEAEVTVERMAQRYIQGLRERQPNGPYLLGGWCFGGVIAFEAARQLRDAGETVTGLALIDTRAPISSNVPNDADDATLLSWFARDLATPFGKALRIAPEALRALPAEDMFAHVLAAARAMEVVSADADIHLLQRYFEVYLANGIALQTYFPNADSLPVLLLRATDEPENFGPALGWQELAPASLTMIELPGDHNSIMYARHAGAVAKAIDSHYRPLPMPGFCT
ncbi:MAG: amino acid adenylation domain-containing protein [Pseudomonadota bacterium]